MITFLDEGLHDLSGKRVGSSYLENRDLLLEAEFRQDVSSDGVTDSAGNDSQGGLVPVVLNKIEKGHRIEGFCNIFDLLIKLLVEDESEPWRCAPSLGVALEAGLPFNVDDGIERDGLLGVRHP